MKGESVHILLFHRVMPERDPLWDPMDPVLFREILAYVNRKYTVVSLEEFFFKERRRFTKTPAIITFDDGYHDFIDYSLPELRKHKMPATMFVVTDCIDNNKPTWTYQLDHLFFNTKKLRTASPPLIKKFDVSAWRSEKERMKYGSLLKQHLKTVSPEKRKSVIAFYESEFADVKQEKKIMMSWEELRQISSEGIEIGSHTVTHPPLATLTDEAEIEKELFVSGMRIREKLGTFPASVSYPVGSYNGKVKNMAHKVGYKLGLAVEQKVYNEERNGRFSIPRLELYNESFFKTKLRVNGTLSRLKKITER